MVHLKQVPKLKVFLHTVLSRRGNCWANAVIESFHSNSKTEEFQYIKFNSLANITVVAMVNEYIIIIMKSEYKKNQAT